MYFQKLEALKQIDKFKNHYMIIDSLDQWLALVPKVYKDRLIPELFSVNQEVAIDISFTLFDELVKINILKERYIVECPCGQVLSFHDNLEESVDFIIKYNENLSECDFCENVVELNTDNVLVVYKLIEKANVSIFTKKKEHPKTFSVSDIKSITLTDRIIADPKKYIEELPASKLREISSPIIREKVEFLTM